MIRDLLLYLVDIFESCELLIEYTKNVRKSAFKSRIQLQDAVFRRIEIIGEATKNLPEKFRKNYPNVPWKKMVGMRNILIHRYHGIDLDETWRIIKTDVPKVKKNIGKIIAEWKQT